ncbi:MAG: hypothetical protein CMJ75_18640 [Planctomycetaceae bacterium]|nr:hypothetical protein [Planctomycetaceae bacterium]
MTALDTTVRAKVGAAFAKLLVEQTIRTFPNRTENDVTGEVTDGTPDDLVWPMSPLLPIERKATDDDTVRESSFIVWLPAEKADGTTLDSTKYPEVGTHIVFGGTAYVVLRSDPFSAGELPAAWQCYVKEA